MNQRRPSPANRIVILGGGPAGVHMAFELKRRGFRDVRILERLEKVGGKVLTWEQDGLPFDLGAGLLPGRSSIYDLCLEIGVELIQIPSDVDLLRIPKIGGGLPEIAAEYRAFKSLTAALDRNIRQLSSEAPRARELSQSFAALLKGEGLHGLNELCSNILYTYGYGTSEEVLAYYGVSFSKYWMNDVLANNLLMVRHGYASAFERMVERAAVDVVTSTEVLAIDEPGRSVRVVRDGRESVERYDFLINTIPHLVCGASVQTLFAGTKMADYPISVVKGPRSPVVSEFNPSPSPYSVNFIVHPTVLRHKSSASGSHEFFVTYQAPNYGAPIHEVDHAARLMGDLTGFFGKDPRQLTVVHRKVWPYFPTFSSEHVAQAYPWKIRDLQGENNTWHVGASCSFESVPNVVEYNLDLLKSFNL